MKDSTRSKRWARVLTGIAAATFLPAALLTASSSATSSPMVPVPSAAQSAEAANANALTPPSNLANVPALPGPLAAKFTLGSSLGVLTTSGSGPQSGVSGSGTEGQPFTISGSGLAANATVAIDWSTASETWVTDVEPSTVNYLGTAAANFNVTLATVTTNASGAFSYQTTVPVDYGGPHTIYAVVNGVEVAQGGFTMLRTLTVTPTSGPIGTPITVTVTGLGATAYTTGMALDWDNHFTGELQAVWTRGTASFEIRAAGPVGQHTIEVGAAVGTLYMNSDQSPVPFANILTTTFTTTKDDGPTAAQIDFPDNVTPTVSEVTTLATANLDPSSTAVASLSQSSGTVGSKVALNVTGLSGSGTDQLVWSSVVGSRVNCPNGSTSCWSFTSTPLGSASITNGDLTSQITIPVTTEGLPGAGLGGWHEIQVMNGTSIEAQVPYYVKESIVAYTNSSGKVLSMGTATAAPIPSGITTPTLTEVAGVGHPTDVFKEGQEFTIAIAGVGWTQLDNTLAVDYDNSFVGYGCGFNSNGYMVVHLFATGGPGTHIIDMYPELYTLNPDYSTTAYGMLPVLTYARDFPGLALGYQVPAIRFAITVVK